jgi:phosphonate transport system substrate-binding protein
VRSVEPAHGRARLAELSAILSRELGTLVVPHHPASYGELVSQYEARELAIAWVPPIATARLQASGLALVLALPVRRGAVSYRAALVTHVDGPASLADMQGASIGWVDRESCAGYVMPRLLLAASSFDLKQLFSRETFFGSHSAVVDAVISRRVQVGATFCPVDTQTDLAAGPRSAPSVRPPPAIGSIPPPGPSFWSGADGKMNPSLRVLAASAAIPNDAIVVSSDLPVDVRSRLLRWFLDLREPASKRLCGELFGANGFRVAAPEHFSALQQMMRAARANGAVV